jgi:hypothetical protein
MVIGFFIKFSFLEIVRILISLAPETIETLAYKEEETN